MIVITAPTPADAGFKFVMLGVAKTVKLTPALATPPAVTTTLPVVAPVGTGTTMLVALQEVGVAAVPLNVTLPAAEPKLLPVIVIAVPMGPELGLKFVMEGVGRTVNASALLVAVPTVTTTLPVVAPAGTGTVMLVALQLVGVPGVPLKVTELVPWVVPKLVPMIVTTVPTGPELGLRLVIVKFVPVPPCPLDPLLELAQPASPRHNTASMPRIEFRNFYSVRNTLPGPEALTELVQPGFQCRLCLSNPLTVLNCNCNLTLRLFFIACDLDYNPPFMAHSLPVNGSEIPFPWKW